MALKLKSIILITISIAAMAALVSEAQLGGIDNPSEIIRIQGIVYCTANGNMGALGSATPVFSNADVQFQCGGSGASSAITDGQGEFSIYLNPLEFVVSSVLANCKLVITSPLAKCNAELPAVGSLISSLEFVGNAVSGFFTVANIVPAGFLFEPSA